MAPVIRKRINSKTSRRGTLLGVVGNVPPKMLKRILVSLLTWLNSLVAILIKFKQM